MQQKDAWFYIQSTLAMAAIFGFFCLLGFGVVGTFFRGSKSFKVKMSILLGIVFMAIAFAFLIFIGALMLNGGHL